MASRVPERQAVAAFLHQTPLADLTARNLNNLNLPSKERKSLVVAFSILRIFGERFAAHLQNAIQDQSMKERFNAVRQITDGFQRDPNYSPPAALLNVPTGMNVYRYVGALRRLSDATRSFPMRKEEKKALRAMMEALRQEENPPFSPEMAMDISKLLFNTVALQFKGQNVYFDQLLLRWRDGSGDNQRKGEALLAALPLRRWIERVPRSDAPFAPPPVGQSFEEYVVQCYIATLQANIGVEFSLKSRQLFEGLFRRGEETDLCVFTGDLSNFYTMKGSFHCTSLQFFLFMRLAYGVRKELHATLLEMILHRNQGWEPQSLQGFQDRQLWTDVVPDFENPYFRTAWEAWERVRRLVASPEQAAQNPYAWLFFSLLWSCQQKNEMLGCYELLRNEGHFEPSLDALYKFSWENRRRLPDHWRFFADIHREIRRRVKLQCEEELFLTIEPAFNIDTRPVEISQAGSLAEGFAAAMRRYDFPAGRKYTRLLRNFILHRQWFLFTCLRDLQAIDIDVHDEVFLDAVLSKQYEEMGNVTEEHRQWAQGKVLQWQARYAFAREELFHLYLTALRLKLRGEEACLEELEQFHSKLQQTYPDIPRIVPYVLLRFHPPLDRSKWESVQADRNAWIGNLEIANNPFPPSEVYTRITGTIEQFIESLTRSWENVELKGMFAQALNTSLRFGLFLQPQLVGDWFCITLTRAGVQWRKHSHVTQQGELKPVVGQANLRIYRRWTIVRNQPVFSFSFYHTEKRKAYSASTTLQVPPEVWEEESGGFWRCLYYCSQMILPEGGDGKGVQEELQRAAALGPDVQAEMVRFLQEVKVTARRLYAASQDSLPELNLGYSTFEIAAVGNIYPSHPRGSLLSEYVLGLTPFPQEAFISDVRDDLVLSCRRKFAQVQQQPIPLGINLSVINEKGELEQKPIWYTVHSSHDLKGEEAGSGGAEVDFYVTFLIGPIHVRLKYPRDVLQEREQSLQMRSLFDFQLLNCKAEHYKRLINASV